MNFNINLTQPSTSYHHSQQQTRNLTQSVGLPGVLSYVCSNNRQGRILTQHRNKKGSLSDYLYQAIWILDSSTIFFLFIITDCQIHHNTTDIHNYTKKVYLSILYSYSLKKEKKKFAALTWRTFGKKLPKKHKTLFTENLTQLPLLKLPYRQTKKNIYQKTNNLRKRKF